MKRPVWKRLLDALGYMIVVTAFLGVFVVGAIRKFVRRGFNRFR